MTAASPKRGRRPPMSEHGNLAVAYTLEALIANEYQSAFNQRVLGLVSAALAAARAEGAQEGFERAASWWDDRCAIVDAYDDDYTPNAVAALLDGVAGAIRALAEKERI